MSRFFESIDEEREEGRKAEVRERTYGTEEKQSKKEKKVQELQCRVLELEEEESQKAFDKQLKKMLVEVKKAEGCFDGVLPPFLRKFLTSPRAYGRTHKKAIDELLSRYESRESAPAEEEAKQDEKGLCKDLSNILVIKDGARRKRELEEFKNSVADEALRAKALVTLLSIHMKSMDVGQVLETIGELIECFFRDEETGALAVFLENIDFYLDTVYGALKTSQLEAYGEVLARLEGVDKIDKVCVGRRILQLEFFKLGRAVETDDQLFRLLYLNRAKEYKESREYYEATRDSIGNGKMEQEVLGEFGMSAFANGDFPTSFEVLCKCSEVKPAGHDLTVNLLCVILNDRVKGSPAHRRFLEGFKEFGRNRFCLPSVNDVFEVYRSFYLLNMLDGEGAGKILSRYCKCFDGSVWLKDFVDSRIKR